MRFEIEQHVLAPLAAVEDTLVDPDFLAHLATLPKLGRPELLDQQTDGDVVRQRVRYRFVGDLNSTARRFIDPNRLTWVEVSALDRSTHRTSFTIEPDHYGSLLRCAGTFVLTATGDGTRRVAQGDLSVSVPLVGRKAEQAIVSGLRDHAAAEATILERWIGQRER